MSDAANLLVALQPILNRIAALDLSRPEAARAELDRELPLTGPLVQAVRAQVVAGLNDGWLCPRQSGEIAFGRVAKAAATAQDLGIDAVHMHGPGPGHVHPNGEVDLCFALDGAPTFDGQDPGWTVYPPESWHVPTVTGGAMIILYFLPGGAIGFGPRPGVSP